jgi:hypothetical protein
MSTKTSRPTLLRGFFEAYLAAQRDVVSACAQPVHDAGQHLTVWQARPTTECSTHGHRNEWRDQLPQ